MTLARSEADLSQAQIDRAFRAFGVLRAQIAAVKAGLPVEEIGNYDWRVELGPTLRREGPRSEDGRF